MRGSGAPIDTILITLRAVLASCQDFNEVTTSTEVVDKHGLAFL